MAVVRLSKSQKQVQFIDDQGNVFVTSSNYLMGLLQGTMAKKLILLNRMPLPVNEDRYPKSPLWDPNGLATKHEHMRDSSAGTDISSEKGKKLRQEQAKKEDINPW